MRSDHLPERKGHEKGKRKLDSDRIGFHNKNNNHSSDDKGFNNADERGNDNLEMSVKMKQAELKSEFTSLFGLVVKRQ